MHNPPNIVEFAFALAQAPGIEGPTPPWLSTLRGFDGLPLSDNDVSVLAAVTGRSRKAIRAHEGQPYPELWARVGRRGRKSATAAMISDHQALYGGHERYLMRGELGLIVTISKDLSGADLIKRFQHLFLNALGIPFHETKFGAVTVTIIEGSQIALACLTCTAEAPRGPAIPVAILDEPAFYATSEVYADPDVEILAALRPAMAQFPNRRLIAISTPFGLTGVFHETVDAALGNNDEKLILAVQGPTWVWNPSINEATTHTLEADPRRWSREYAAVASGTSSSAFGDPEHIKRAFKLKAPPGPGNGFAAIDPSSLRSDEFAYIFGYEANGLIRVDEVGAFGQEDFKTHTMADIVRKLSMKARARGVSRVISDQREAAGLTSLFAENSCELEVLNWSQSSKESACSLLRRLFQDSKISIVEHRQLKDELIKARAILTPDGHTKYPLTGLDFASCLVSLVMARQTTISLAGGESKLDAAIRDCIAKGELCPPNIGYQPGVARNSRMWEELTE